MQKSEKIMHKSYKYNGVDYNEYDGTYHLDQKKNTIKQFEIDGGDEDHSIISMKMGVPQKINRTAATRIKETIVDERIPSLKKKTKLVIRDENEGVPVPVPVPVPLPLPFEGPDYEERNIGD